MNIEDRINELLGRMTLAEKVGQLNEAALNQPMEALRERVRAGSTGVLVGAFSAFAGHEKGKIETDINDELQRIAVEESRLGIPLIIGRDIIHGHRTVFPIPLAQAASWDCEAVREANGFMALEAAADGYHWTYAPMLDVSRDPRWGRMVEGYGEDPYLAARMAEAAIKGLGDQGLAACAKHYIGYGASEGGRDYASTEISDYSLYNDYLPPFRAAVEAGVQTVMSSFNDINGEPVSGSYRLLTKLLKEELGFEGFIVSDWDAVQQLIAQGVAAGEKEAARIAFSAGVDVDGVQELFLRFLPELAAEGKVSVERLDDAVRRVLRVKFQLGLFDHPYGLKPSKPPLNKPLARRIAAECMVLLKNRDNLLPLPKKGLKIALVGPFADIRDAHLGAWSLDGQAGDVVTAAEGVQAALPDCKIILPESILFDDVITAARKADIVIAVLGESRDKTGEARSAASLEPTGDQIALLREIHRFTDNIVSVICAGRPLDLTEVLRHSKSVLYAWHLGIEAGNAMADVLFGTVNPGGKLPCTFPRGTGQIPIYYNHRSSGRSTDEYYGDAEFANYQDIPGSPLFPFGFGLQYTTYEYGEVVVDKNTVAVDVTNTGSRLGVETVQLYLRDERAEIIRPVRLLKGFSRVSLAPGETKTVRFTLGEEELSYYAPNGSRIPGSGWFTIWVGGDCVSGKRVYWHDITLVNVR